MPDAVVVATARSPIGRAGKGTLVDLRPDDLTATVIRAALDKLPQLDPPDDSNACPSAENIRDRADACMVRNDDPVVTSHSLIDLSSTDASRRPSGAKAIDQIQPV